LAKFWLVLEAEYDWMPKKQNFEQVSADQMNTSVPLICPSGSGDNKSTFF